MTEQDVLADWKKKFETLSDELDKLIKETGAEWFQKKKKEFEDAQGKRAIEFPRVLFFKPAEVLVFQPSITGLSGGVTGLNLSVTGASFAYSCFKGRNGGAGFEPAVFDNSDKVMASCLCGNRLEADMIDASNRMEMSIDCLNLFKAALQSEKNEQFKLIE